MCPYLFLGSASSKGKFTWYGEKCASTMAVAYSSGDMDEPKIVSLPKNCILIVSGMNPL